MENNKLLIGVQFTEEKPGGQAAPALESSYQHTHIELYVLRDITLIQLLEGIKYGLAKSVATETTHQSTYIHCQEIFDQCFADANAEVLGTPIYKNITLTHFQETSSSPRVTASRFAFDATCLDKPLYKLGFIDSTRIIFDQTGSYTPKGKYNTEAMIEAFDPAMSQKISFPEYNISTRQLYQFDSSPIRIIPPTAPPQKPNQGLAEMLKPALLSLGVMLIARMAFTSGSLAGGMAAAAISIAMGAVSVFNISGAHKKQKAAYAQSLKNWRSRYEVYIRDLIANITRRQNADVEKLQNLYPDSYVLISEGDKSVYSLNGNIFSRDPADPDFLTFRIGLSDDVPSLFTVEGEQQDTVFSEAFFGLEQEQGKTNLRIYLRDEKEPAGVQLRNLCDLPFYLNQRYLKLNDAPLLYSLKDKGALGIVDRGVEERFSRSHYFISRMIFELCYYHSPEDLQFVIFFDKQDRWHTIESFIDRYKFMPHFRGLFGDKSQFVFDAAGAHAVMSNLLSIMQQRSADSEGNITKKPHVVMIVFDEHGLKEHAFAQFLPNAPKAGEAFVNHVGLSFVFAVEHKEYLPHYCDDVVHFNGKTMTLTPRFDASKRQRFEYPKLDSAVNVPQFIQNYEERSLRAFQFLSSVYYAKIAENGKVPSSVSLFDILDAPPEKLPEMIKDNWNRTDPGSYTPITKSLSVPIGMTEKGKAFLDLHEKKDGPHMLVAGTTGSGKSETILSYLLGLCLKFRPDELNLLLVDMKGGGFTKRLGHLPHVVGKITDVEGDENGTSAEYMLRRFLDAMQFEIKRRKLALNALRVDSVDDYIKACADIESHIIHKNIPKDQQALVRETAENPLSHLILVVDEFTELKRFASENSDIDYIGEITSLARIGRSLGFHIILISQNIEGAITDDIRVNSRARLCHRVATAQASKEMLGSDVAASPRMPKTGRAYLQVGTGDRLDYFQAAYSGASSFSTIPIEFTLASKTGTYSVFYHSDIDNTVLMKQKKLRKEKRIERTQLEVITEAICKAGEDLKYKKHQIFSAPLAVCMALDPSGTKPYVIRKQVKAHETDHGSV